MDDNAIVGSWDAMGLEFSIVAEGDELVVVYPDAPTGFESPLREVGEGEYELMSGPFAGAVCALTDDADVMTVGGVVDATRLVRPAQTPPGGGLRAPNVDLQPEQEDRYESAWESILQRRDGGIVNHPGPEPVHEFVQWLSARNLVIFHGSNKADIDEFRPVRTSMELKDTTGRGNLGAVYGTHDGLWSTFFATIDRRQLRGSIRNGFSEFTNRKTTEPLRIYQFSIHHECLPERPFTTGALYLLPRDSFAQIPFYPGGPLSNEWASHEPVLPLARLIVEPTDFPFLDDIGGHDDELLLEFGRLGEEVWGGLVSARRTDDGFAIVTTTGRAVIDRFIAASLDWYPEVVRIAKDHTEGTEISMTGPPAFLHGMEDRLRTAFGSGWS